MMYKGIDRMLILIDLALYCYILFSIMFVLTLRLSNEPGLHEKVKSLSMCHMPI